MVKIKKKIKDEKVIKSSVKKAMKNIKKPKWKQIAIDNLDNDLNDEFFKEMEGFVALEELDNYDTFGDNIFSDKRKGKKEKKEKRKDKNIKTTSNDITVVDEEAIDEDALSIDDEDEVDNEDNISLIDAQNSDDDLEDRINSVMNNDEIIENIKYDYKNESTNYKINSLNSQNLQPLPKTSPWRAFPLSENIFTAINQLSFPVPTPIQSACITPAIKQQLDILGAAPTGSGKTLAFGIPLIQFIWKEKKKMKKNSEQSLRALVLVPTRELAIQVKSHLNAIGQYCKISCESVVGGLSLLKQERILDTRKPEILVATPGRLWELITQSDCKHTQVGKIKNISHLIIDEADRMVEKGHFEEFLKLIDLLKFDNKKDDNGVKKRQTMIFSATLTFVHEDKKTITIAEAKNKKINSKQKLRLMIDLLNLKLKSLRVIDLTEKGLGIPDEEKLYTTKITCLAEDKDIYLYYFLIHHPGKTIIFTNSKDCLRRLNNILKILKFDVCTLHGSMEQKKRLMSIERFTANSKSTKETTPATEKSIILLASDVAARGLDIASVEHVIHYQVPRTTEIYVHRSGRTARGNEKGLSLLLIEPKEAYLYEKLCKVINDGNDIRAFPTEETLVKLVRDRVKLAREIDLLDHTIKKNNSKDNWFKKAANAAGIDIDDRDDIFARNNFERDLANFEAGEGGNTSSQKVIKVMKKRLDNMLKQPLVSRSIFSSYLTKYGAFNLENKFGKNAIERVIESDQKTSKIIDYKFKTGKKRKTKNNVKKANKSKSKKSK